MARFERVFVRGLRWRLAIPAALCVFAFLLFLAYLGFLLLQLRDVTDPRRYQSVVKELRSEPLFGAGGLACFPASIPAEAANVRFWYRPQVAQAGDFMELGYALPSAEVASLLARSAQLAKETARGTAPDDLNHEAILALPTLFAHTEEDAVIPRLPPSFTIYVMQMSPDYFTSHSGDWIYDCGIAIDAQHNEVVYWLEDGD